METQKSRDPQNSESARKRRELMKLILVSIIVDVFGLVTRYGILFLWPVDSKIPNTTVAAPPTLLILSLSMMIMYKISRKKHKGTYIWADGVRRLVAIGWWTMAAITLVVTIIALYRVFSLVSQP